MFWKGYGLTETAPVVSTNLPDPAPSRPNDTVQPSSRDGSVGKMLPGEAAQIRDPETNALLSPHELGMLWLKGPNIFEGYLNEPERTAEVLQDGWFKTGDLGRLDEDGFLYIEGRLSRFSKIAGEMVPHETIEAKIIEGFGLKMEEERVIAIVGVPDEAKGEALVLLAIRDLSPEKIREYLLAGGLPNLWVPRTIKRVEKIPILGSGKLDLGKMQGIGDCRSSVRPVRQVQSSACRRLQPGVQDQRSLDSALPRYVTCDADSTAICTCIPLCARRWRADDDRACWQVEKLWVPEEVGAASPVKNRG